MYSRLLTLFIFGFRILLVVCMVGVCHDRTSFAEGSFDLSALAKIVLTTQPARFAGLNGYLDFADRFHHRGLSNAYDFARTHLSAPEFRELGWKRYRGTTDDFFKERARFYDQDEPGFKYRNRVGQLRYAEDFYPNFRNGQLVGSLQRAHANVAAALGPEAFARLGWGNSYLGDTAGFRRDRELLFPDFFPDNRYRGRRGYLLFADGEGYNGDMLKAFINAAAATSSQEFAELDWGPAYRGSTKLYREERSVLYPAGKVNPFYKEIEGYYEYSRRAPYFSNMEKAFLNASAISDEEEFAELNWGISFAGTIEQRLAIIQLLTAPNGQLDFDKWSGQGLQLATRTYIESVGQDPTDSRVFALYRKKIRAAVSFDERKRLRWLRSGYYRRDAICREAYGF